MSPTLRRFAACFLLLLLPLQALANAGTFSCAQYMPACHEMHGQSADCCEHAPSSRQAGDTDHGAGQGGQHDMSPCPGANSCAPAVAMAVLPSAPLILPIVADGQRGLFLLSRYISHIPDGLQRPPSILA